MLQGKLALRVAGAAALVLSFFVFAGDATAQPGKRGKGGKGGEGGGDEVAKLQAELEKLKAQTAKVEEALKNARSKKGPGGRPMPGPFGGDKGKGWGKEGFGKGGFGKGGWGKEGFGKGKEGFGKFKGKEEKGGKERGGKEKGKREERGGGRGGNDLEKRLDKLAEELAELKKLIRRR